MIINTLSGKKILLRLLKGFFQPDLRQHEIVDAAVVLLFDRSRVNEVTQILVHHLGNEGCERSLKG